MLTAEQYENCTDADGNEIDAESFYDLVQNETPQDFYFAAYSRPDYDPPVIEVVITPKSYYDKYNYMWDQHLGISNLLPDYLEEMCESMFSVENYNPEDNLLELVNKDLLDRGFIFNQNLMPSEEEQLEYENSHDIEKQINNKCQGDCQEDCGGNCGDKCKDNCGGGCCGKGCCSKDKEPEHLFSEKYQQFVDEVQKHVQAKKDAEEKYTKEEYVELIQNIAQDIFKISFDEMKQTLCSFVDNHAEELSRQFINIAPFGDYDLLMESNDEMTSFLRQEATKLENWHIMSLFPSDVNKGLMEFIFVSSVCGDDDEEFKGFVYVNDSGKIKHAFAQGENCDDY